MKYSLYVKTHNITGLKYLGYTSQDPFLYKGSGKYWKNHLNRHGCNVSTEVIFESADKSEIKQKGIFYSQLWNVVSSTNWANLTEEKGDGGVVPFNGEANKINARLGGLAKAKLKLPAWNKGLVCGPEPETTRKKKSASHKGMRRSYREDGTWFWIKPLQRTQELVPTP